MLETERLILRKWTEEDAESLFEYAKDPEIGPAAGWPPHKSVEESRAVIKNVFDGAECYAICEKEKNIAIGAVELKLNGHTNTTKRDDECELGYWLGQPFWGRGYMPEASSSKTSSTLRPVFAEIKGASSASIPITSSISSFTLSGSALGRSILLITGTTSRS